MPAAKRKKNLTPLEKQIAELKASLPAQQDWRTTDEQETTRRQVRALENPPAIRQITAGDKIHATFEITSNDSDRTYHVEIIDLSKHLFHSTTPDFATNGLGTCKHTEAVLFHLRKRYPRLYKAAEKNGPPHATLVIHNDDLQLHGTGTCTIPRKLRLCVQSNGLRKESCPPEKLIATALEHAPESVRVSARVAPWLRKKQHAAECLQLQRSYQQKVHSGEFPAHETLLPLYPYQHEGMLHLAFKERAMVADEMGLGKTIQGIAAAALLHRLGKADRCLIVAPASLKAEWEEQIEKFTTLPCEIVYGNRSQRCHTYQNPAAFFIITNYEQIRSDSLDINAALKPDIVILDEAQRIKNWSSLTARAIKRLHSRYAFVLTGTPIENRIDELYSIIEFLDPSIFGALFRFNRQFYLLDDERGKPQGYRNLDQLRQKVAPVILRRRKAQVETELPDRTDENRFITLTEGQKSDYAAHEDTVRRLANLGKKRPLRPEEHQRLMGALGCMRMLCDTQFILDKETRTSPKLDELKEIIETALQEPENKIIIFSEWIGMLTLIREHLIENKIGHAWHTGKVPQKKRRLEIKAFKTDPDCKIILCTESGGAGLNLQNASIVINCDLPWNPAKLEQRIARAWRKGQQKPVQVINLIAEGTIEHGMLDTLAMKQGLADGVLDGIGKISEIQLKKGGQSFLARLQQTLEAGKQHASTAAKKTKTPPADPAKELATRLQKKLGKNLLHAEQHFLTRELHNASSDSTDTETDPALQKIYLVTNTVTKALKNEIQQLCGQLYPRHNTTPDWLENNIILVDQTTHDSLQQLQRAGLLQTNTRARRNLLEPDPEKPAPTHTPEQLAEIKRHQHQKQEQLTAANALTAAQLPHLATPHLKNAILHHSQLTALQTHQTPPETLADLREVPHKSLLPENILTMLEKEILTSEEKEHLTRALN
ncbi:MAG: DEAD/DEAH box helicase [Akkermansiaceae bacterium]|nr:DEAD/DEAH box helicase [Akkermansiaceae bacterium]